MKIYNPEYIHKARHVIFVQPGNDHQVSDWFEDGSAKMIVVEFRYGCADLASNLAQYMIDKSLAQLSRLLLPTKHLGGLNNA